MADCSKCGKEAMTFTCKYCGEKFCSEHRLPENHSCESMEEEIEKQKEQDSNKWFEEKKVKKPAPSQITNKKREKPSMLQDIKNTFSRNYTLAIIAVTVVSFFMQYFIPGYNDLLVLSPALTETAVQATNNVAGGQLLSYSLVQKPWTLLTVVLAHGGLFHLFANMITFYFFGTPTERLIGSKKLLKFYLAATLVSSLGYIISRNILFEFYGPMVNSLPTLMPAVGASGAVVATFAVVAMLYPEAEVLLYFIVPMKIRTALYAFIGLEMFNFLAKAFGYYLPLIGNFASSAHLAGLAVGIWYGKKLQDKYARKTSVFDPLGY